MKTAPLLQFLSASCLTAATAFVIAACSHAPSPNDPPPTPPPSAPHAVIQDKELLITEPALLDPTKNPTAKEWTFRAVMQALAGSSDVDAFAQAWINTWSTNTQVSDATGAFDARPETGKALAEAWQNPDRIKLIAIVNRLDLTRFMNGNINFPVELGEGRFVYEVRNAKNEPQRATIIVEFGLDPAQFNLPPKPPANPDPDVVESLHRWAERWHKLGGEALGSPKEFSQAYSDELAALVHDFAKPDHLHQVRTNEFLSGSGWELREFHLHQRGSTGSLDQVLVALTPDHARFAAEPGANELGRFIDSIKGRVIDGTRIDGRAGLLRNPEPTENDRGDPKWRTFQGAVAALPSPSFKWRPNGADPRARAITSFNTCNGCHGGDAGTFFQHIRTVTNPRQDLPPTLTLSPFLSGKIQLEEPLPNSSSTEHDEMAERGRFLAQNAEAPTAVHAAATVQLLTPIITGRVGRVH